MSRADQYLAIVVAGMFLAGVLWIVQKIRQQSRTRHQWSGDPPARRNNAA